MARSMVASRLGVSPAHRRSQAATLRAMTASWAKNRRESGWLRAISTASMGLAIALGVAACGSSSASRGSTESPDASSASSPSGVASTPAAAPQTISDTGVQIQVPGDWNVSKESNGTTADPPNKAGSNTTSGGLDLQSNPEPLGTIQDDVKTVINGAKGEGGTNVKRLPDLKVGGMTIYHVQYEGAGQWVDNYGTVVDGNGIHVLWEFFKSGSNGVTRAEADKLIAPVMATLKATP